MSERCLIGVLLLSGVSGLIGCFLWSESPEEELPPPLTVLQAQAELPWLFWTSSTGIVLASEGGIHLIDPETGAAETVFGLCSSVGPRRALPYPRCRGLTERNSRRAAHLLPSQ